MYPNFETNQKMANPYLKDANTHAIFNQLSGNMQKKVAKLSK